MIQCERGHFYDENRFQGCPYCSQVSAAPRSVNPPVAPLNMAIPQPSCGKTVPIEGVELEPQVSKTVAIDSFEVDAAPLHKTVAISENQLPPVPEVAPAVAAVPVVPSTPETPYAAPVVPSAPETSYAAPQVVASTPVVDTMAASYNPIQQQNIATEPVYPVTGLGVAENPQPIPQEEVPVYQPSDRPYAVTGLGVKENPQPIAKEAEKYYQPSDRPYAVTGLGIKENPTPIPVDTGATFPIPGGAENPASAGAQPEAAAFAAFAFPGGPMPGMFPGGPIPGAPIPKVEVPNIEVPPVEVPSIDIPSVESVYETPAMTDDVVAEPEQIPVAVESEQVVSEPVAVPNVAVEEPVQPDDPNATVTITESDMDYTPRTHTRAFFVCIDGPMTGASFVFRENKAIIGRQMDYEISLFRDNSVSRNPHAIINYYQDAIRYTVSCGDAEKRVSVNGQYISVETELKLYDVVGIGQSRLLFVPICSEKFAW